MLASIVNTARSAAMVWNALQWPSSWPVEYVIDSIGESIDGYFDARHLIPPGNLVEVRHEDLVADEAGTLARIYEGIGLQQPHPSAAHRPAGPTREYRRNAHHPLDKDVLELLRSRCARMYEAGWYPPAESLPPCDRCE